MRSHLAPAELGQDPNPIDASYRVARLGFRDPGIVIVGSAAWAGKDVVGAADGLRDEAADDLPFGREEQVNLPLVYASRLPTLEFLSRLDSMSVEPKLWFTREHISSIWGVRPYRGRFTLRWS